MHRCDRVVGEQQVILRVASGGSAGTALVINERTNACRRELALQRVEITCRIVLRSVDQNDDWYATAALRHNEATRQADASALKFCLRHVEYDSLTLHTIETDFASGAIREGDTLSIGTFGPAEGANPAVVALFGQLSGGAVVAPPPQMRTFRRSNIDIGAVLQVVCADPAITCQSVRRYCALSSKREHRRRDNCYSNVHFHL